MACYPVISWKILCSKTFRGINKLSYLELCISLGSSITAVLFVIFFFFFFFFLSNTPSEPVQISRVQSD